MVKITDGKTPPATEAYREGWERIFGEKEHKCCNKPNCCGGHIIAGTIEIKKCYHRNWLYQEDGQAIYGRYTKDCPDCNGTGELLTIRKEEDGSNL